jgi:hypothetical protein
MTQRKLLAEELVSGPVILLVSATAVANILASRTQFAWARTNGTFVVHTIEVYLLLVERDCRSWKVKKEDQSSAKSDPVKTLLGWSVVGSDPSSITLTHMYSRLRQDSGKLNRTYFKLNNCA